MPRDYLISISGIFLTDDGLSTGNRCRTRVTGLGRLLLTQGGTSRPNADGTPIVQLAAIKNAPVSVSLENQLTSIFNSLVTEYQDYINSGTPFSLTIVGGPANFTGGTALSVVPDFPNPIEFGEFIEDMTREVTFNMRTT